MRLSVPSRLALGGIALLPMLLAPTSPAQAPDPSLRVAAALYDGIRTATLPNGLRVFIKPVPESPVCRVCLRWGETRSASH